MRGNDLAVLTRSVLYVAAVLTGAYAALTWALGMLTHAGVAGAISAAAVVAAEGIWHCTQRKRERVRQYREAIWQRRIESVPCAIRGGRDPWWLEELPDDMFADWRGSWPSDAGAPE